jgi:aldose sugar dehydrogenase
MVSVVFSVATSEVALAAEIADQPIIRDNNMAVQVVFEGLNFPTNMAFLGPDDILVLEKNDGTVRRIINGDMMPEPLLKVNVSDSSERGMLGIALGKNQTNNEIPFYVFLYYTEPEQENKTGKYADIPESKFSAASNNIYRYELVEGKLTNPKNLLRLPTLYDAGHNGGVLLFGPDNNLYASSGSVALDRPETEHDNTWSQNVVEGPEADGRGGILRFTEVGKSEEGSHILSNEYPMNLYYAYGIRNSFGMDFDPESGLLWDTENGDSMDEINLVEPGFNSGWRQIMGLSSSMDEFDSNKLVDFEGKGKYSDPEFVWKKGVGPTALEFLNSDAYGPEYQNDMFVADFHNGNIYHFKLNKDRTELILPGDLRDKIADDVDELEDVIFGQGFGGITDLEVGPDGYLYVLSLHQGGSNCSSSERNCVKYDSEVQGVIFRISPK